MRRRHCLGQAAATVLMPAARAEVIDLNDAINKAGRQRMLSLRTAKVYGVLGLRASVAAATAVQAQSVALFDRQLVELKAFAPRPEICATYRRVDTARGVVADNAVAEINQARVDFGSAQQLLRAAPENTAGLGALPEQAQGEFAACVAASNKLLSGAADAPLAANVFNSSERMLQVAKAVADHCARLPA